MTVSMIHDHDEIHEHDAYMASCSMQYLSLIVRLHHRVDVEF